MPIHIGENPCIGSGSCVLQAPAHFDRRDEDGTAVVLDPSDVDRDLIGTAVRSCPVGAVPW